MCILSTLIILLAVGTFYESFYGRDIAQEVIYQSVWMVCLLFLLALNIVAVMIDRLPWRKKHIAFLTAHVGILLVCTGALLTRYYGIDGNVRIALGESASTITTSEVHLAVYSSFNGQNLTTLYRKKAKFFSHPPSLHKPYKIPLGSSILKVTGYYPFATTREHYKKAQGKGGGVAVRFQIEGVNAHIVSWLFKPLSQVESKKVFGPAYMVLTKDLKNHKVLKKTHALIMAPFDNRYLHYKLHHSLSDKPTTGRLKVGSVLATGWMDLQFRVLSYLPKAVPDMVFTPQKRVSENTTSAIQINFKNQSSWMGLNSHLYFFEKDKVFIVAYVNDKKKLGFNIQLKEFKIKKYPASQKALSYESTVVITNNSDKNQHDKNQQSKTHTISMNEPLKQSGYTIYQSGFEEDSHGLPQASILAINKDPGRVWKYIGSILVVLGCLLLFMKKKSHPEVSL